MAKFNPAKRMNPYIQIGIMKNLLSNTAVSHKGNNAILKGDIFVAPEIHYTVSIECSIENKPIVNIMNPTVKENAPHRYSDKSLCLYYPANFKWSEKTNLIVKQIIPWTAMWIYCYEFWLQTGEWIGGAFPHSSKKKEN
jgi:hypothetical protein